MPPNKESRSIENSVLILAPADVVWKALTDARELTQWFPLEAHVKPGEGGAIWMSWKNEYQFDTPIAIWKPETHLRLIYLEPTPAAPPGQPGPPFKIPHQVAVDYFLETKSGETTLRVVQSGFSADASWDAQYDATVTGWEFQLQGLKLYLERHRGTPRRCIVSRAAIPTLTPAQAWSKLWSPDALLRVTHPEPTRAGERYAITTAQGDRLEGVAHTLAPPKDFSATITNLNDAWWRLHIDDLPLWGKRDVNNWISTYGLEKSRVAELQEHFDRMLSNLAQTSCDV